MMTLKLKLVALLIAGVVVYYGIQAVNWLSVVTIKVPTR